MLRPEVVWRGAASPCYAEAFCLNLPAGFLAPGPYRIEVVAVRAGGEDLAARYEVEVTSHPTASPEASREGE